MANSRYNRQTFLDVADALKRAGERATVDGVGAELGIEYAADEIANKFAERASGFDKELFLRNAGIRE